MSIKIELDIQWSGGTPIFAFSSTFAGVYPDGTLDLRAAGDDVVISFSLVADGVKFASPTIAITHHRDKSLVGCPNADDNGRGVFTVTGLFNNDQDFKMTDKNRGHELFSYALWFVSDEKGLFSCDPIIINK